MKKLTALLLALAMVLSLAACGASEPAATEAPKAEAPAATEAPAAEAPAAKTAADLKLGFTGSRDVYFIFTSGGYAGISGILAPGNRNGSFRH